MSEDESESGVFFLGIDFDEIPRMTTIDLPTLGCSNPTGDVQFHADHSGVNYYCRNVIIDSKAIAGRILVDGVDIMMENEKLREELALLYAGKMA